LDQTLRVSRAETETLRSIDTLNLPRVDQKAPTRALYRAVSGTRETLKIVPIPSPFWVEEGVAPVAAFQYVAWSASRVEKSTRVMEPKAPVLGNSPAKSS